MTHKPLVAITLITIAAQMSHISPAVAATQSDDRTMTTLAAQILADAATARKALASGKTTASTTDIEKALAARGKLARAARREHMAMIVPLYMELDDTEVLSNAVKSKVGTTSDGKAVGRTGAPRTVRANDALLTFIAIDLDKAKSRLDAAKRAVTKHNDRAADDSLAAVGSDLIEESVITDVPLLTAREDLSRAQTELNANDRSAASADLRQASKSLSDYTTGGHVKDARVLASTIDADARSGKPSGSTATMKIEKWWSSVTDWFARKA